MGLGHPSMDLQNTLRSVSRFLIRDGRIHQIGSLLELSITHHDGFYTIFHQSVLGGNSISSSGTNRNILTAYLKSIVEFGEEILRVQLNLNNRSGISGGLSEKNITLRAQVEVLERDSFLFHYRQRLPMKKIKEITVGERVFSAFEMVCLDPRFRAVLIRESSRSYQGRLIAHFSTAVNETTELAIEKAVEEYVSLETFFEDNAESINMLITGKYHLDNPLLPHMAAMFDPRNVEILNVLTGNITDNSPTSEDNIVLHRFQGLPRTRPKWIISNLVSPLKFFKYLRAESPDAEKFVFGVPENGIWPALFHPFW